MQIASEPESEARPARRMLGAVDGVDEARALQPRPQEFQRLLEARIAGLFLAVDEELQADRDVADQLPQGADGKNMGEELTLVVATPRPKI